jgi:type IV pilus assembly protein PilV
MISKQPTIPVHLALGARRLGQQGFSLIEVLVTLLITTLALFGTAGLQAYSLRVNQLGKFRGQAVFLVNDLAERMEANFTMAEQYDIATTSTVPTLGTDCSSANCNATALASYDLAQWQNAVATALPQSTWSVVSAPLISASPLISTTFTLSWQERATAAPNTTSTATVTATYVTSRLIKSTP